MSKLADSLLEGCTDPTSRADNRSTRRCWATSGSSPTPCTSHQQRVGTRRSRWQDSSYPPTHARLLLATSVRVGWCVTGAPRSARSRGMGCTAMLSGAMVSSRSASTATVISSTHEGSRTHPLASIWGFRSTASCCDGGWTWAGWILPANAECAVASRRPRPLHADGVEEVEPRECKEGRDCSSPQARVRRLQRRCEGERRWHRGQARDAAAAPAPAHRDARNVGLPPISR